MSHSSLKALNTFPLHLELNALQGNLQNPARPPPCPPLRSHLSLPLSPSTTALQLYAPHFISRIH